MSQNLLLSKNAQIIQDTLFQKGLQCTVLELPDSARTSGDAANAIGCEIAQIMKSLIFRTEDNQPVLVLASGPNRVNEKIIEKHVGKKILKADAIFVREVTGFAIGGVPPICHKQKIHHVFIDQDLLQFEDCWAAAGTPNAVFKLKTNDISALSDGKVISIVSS